MKLDRKCHKILHLFLVWNTAGQGRMCDKCTGHGMIKVAKIRAGELQVAKIAYRAASSEYQTRVRSRRWRSKSQTDIGKTHPIKIFWVGFVQVILATNISCHKFDACLFFIIFAIMTGWSVCQRKEEKRGRKIGWVT